MARVYLTVYKPHVGTEKPSLYIGSTSKPEDAGYLGSVQSKEWKKFWAEEIKRNPNNFDHFTLSQHGTMEEALVEEYETQKAIGVVKDPRFFNKSLANVNGFFGMNVSGANNPMFGKSRKGERLGGAVTSVAGKNNPMYGKDWRVGKTSEELAEHAKKLSKPGELNPAYGSTFLWINKGDEYKRHDKNMPIPNGWVVGFPLTSAMQEARKRRVRCIDTGVIYESSAEAARKTGSPQEKITMCCRGQRKKTNHLRWEYVE